MGDVAICVPVILSLIDKYPDVKVSVLTKKNFAPIFSQIENCEVILADFKQKHKGFLGLFRLFKELKCFNFDYIADFHSVLRTHILSFFFLFTGVPFVKIDKGRQEKKALIHLKNKNFKPLRPSFLRYADVLKKLGFDISFEKKYFLKKNLISENVKKILKTDSKKIGFAPFAAHKGKEYDFFILKDVIYKISLNSENQLFVFGGGESEKQKVEEIVSENIINTIGKFSFEEELQIISSLDCMVSMDSGNGHLSAMFGVETLTLWGVTHPFAGFTPYGQPENNQLLADRDKFPLIPTSVFGNKYPEGYQNAINSIKKEDILLKIEEILSKK